MTKSFNNLRIPVNKGNQLRFVILVGLVALVFSAEARIGETEEQCVGRYGKVVRREHNEKPPAEACVFETGRFVVKAYFLNGHVAALLIHPANQTQFTEDELSVIMKANSSGATWKEVETASGAREFRRSDEVAMMFIIKGEVLSIGSAEWKAAREGMSKF
jgi:hypothetical protein